LDLLNPEILRRTLDSLTLRLDGKPGSPVVVSRRRKVFTAMLEYRRGLAATGARSGRRRAAARRAE
jgi:hypothetical protein